MKQDFPSSMTQAEALLRVAAMHTPGRKHQKRKGVKAAQRAKNSSLRAAKLKIIRSRGLHSQIQAYWRGERDTNPAAK